MKTAVITQSNYIPWKGYFDQLLRADIFVVYDCVQYTRRDWRNRNKIKTPAGVKWLTIPVEVKGKFSQKISETKIADSLWAEKHWRMIRQNYSKADCFRSLESWIQGLYESAGELEFLSEVNLLFLRSIGHFLGNEPEFRNSAEFSLSDDRNERLIDLCIALGADNYLSGPAAKSYMQENLFLKKGITVEWCDYSGYPEYVQLHGDFEHGVSILDLLFSKGEDAGSYLKYANEPSSLARVA